MTPNLSRNERLLTMVAGVGAMGLAVYLPRLRTPLAMTSATLIARATAGFCPVTAAMSPSRGPNDFIGIDQPERSA